LVEEDEVGVAGDAEREVETALLAAGECLDAGLHLLAEPDELEDLLWLPRVRIGGREDPDGLDDRHRRRVAGLLDHDADAVLEVLPSVGGVVSEHLDLPIVPEPVAFEDLAEGSPARAIRPEEAEHL